MTNKNKTIHSTIDVGEITTYELPHMELREGSRTIDVEKSSYHHVSHPEIASDKPCSQ